MVHSYHKLLEIGVKDSKKLKDNRIKELANHIYNIVKGKFAIQNRMGPDYPGFAYWQLPPDSVSGRL